MATNIVAWMQQANAYFPKDNTLLEKWIREDAFLEKYLQFDDNYFWKALRDMVDNPLACFSQKEIVNFCRLLLSHKGLNMIPESEIRFESDDPNKAKEKIQQKVFLGAPDGTTTPPVTLFSSIGFTKHVPISDFNNALNAEAKSILESDKDDTDLNEDESKKAIEEKQKNQRVRRLMDGMAVEKDDGSICLLCDDEGSLMHYLYKIKLYIIRQYDLSTF